MKINSKITGFGSNINGYYDVENQLPDYLRRLAEKYFDIEDDEKSRIKSVEAFEERRREVKKRFIDGIGGLDIEKTPLNPRVTGKFDHEGFTVQNIIYESRPGAYVTANLYVPRGAQTPAPAVLMACGHSEDGKACVAYQKVAIDLANNGFIVFVVDPVGQGERFQYNDFDENGKYRIGACTLEHTYEGQQCVLTGSNVAQYFIWDLIRGIDYLESLDIVDNSRIGMTGNSGGGTQTAYMMLCEDRLSAAMPCCYITSKIDYMKTGQIHDAEQNVFGVIPSGVNYDDYITAMAPKPAMIGCARFDFFCIEGSVKTYERAKNIYTLYGRGDNVGITVSESTHGFSDHLREAAVNFFIEAFMGKKGEFKTNPDRPVFATERLQCTRAGQAALEFDSFKSVYEYNCERYDNLKYSETNDLIELRQRVLRVMNFPMDIGNREPIIYPRVITDNTADGIRIRKMFFFTEEDICCTGILLTADDKPADRCTIYVSNDSTDEISEHSEAIGRLLDEGGVFIFDPRGTGAVKSRDVRKGQTRNPYGLIYDNEYKLNCDAVMLGTSLCALRVYDIVRACDLMRGYFGFGIIAIAGADYGALYALTAAVVLGDSAAVYTNGEVIRFGELVQKQYYGCNPKNNIHGLLREYDTPLLVRILGAKSL